MSSAPTPTSQRPRYGRGRLVRGGRVAVIVLALAPLLAVSLTNANPVSASVGLLPVLLPASAAVTVGGSAASTAVFTVSGVAGTAAAATTAVAVAPIALVAGALIVGAGAVYLGLKWANGASNGGTKFDPAPATGVTGTWTQVDASCTTTSGSIACGDRALTWLDVPKAGTAGPWNVSLRSERSFNASYLDYRLEMSDGTTRNGQTYVACPGESISLCISITGSHPAVAGVTLTAVRARESDVVKGTYARADSAPSAPSGSSLVTTRPTSQCSGGTAVVGAAVTFSGGQAAPPPIIAPACPAGQTRTGFTSPSTYPDGSSAPALVDPVVAPIVPSGYPECSGANGYCVLTLLQAAPGGSPVITCNNTTACTGWATDASEEKTTTQTGAETQTQRFPDGTTRTVTPRTRPDGSTMRCRWGPYTIPASECTTVPTETKSATATEPSEGNCNLSDFSLNPVSWVVVPLKCLFIPSPAGVAKVKTAAGTLGTVVPFSYVGDMTAWTDELVVPEDCLKIDFNVPQAWEGYTDGKARVLDMCQPAGRPENILVQYRTLLEVATWSLLIVPILWWAWGAYAPGTAGDA